MTKSSLEIEYNALCLLVHTAATETFTPRCLCGLLAAILSPWEVYSDHF